MRIWKQIDEERLQTSKYRGRKTIEKREGEIAQKDMREISHKLWKKMQEKELHDLYGNTLKWHSIY